MKFGKLSASLFFIIVLVSPFIVFSAENPATMQAETDSLPVTKFATIDVLVVIYTNTAGARISDDAISRIKNGIELSRIFFWRNSDTKLNLAISFIIHRTSTIHYLTLEISPQHT